MFTNNKKKLDLANAAKDAMEKQHEAEKKAHEASKVEIQRLKAENESMKAQLNKAIDVAGSAMNGRWYADDGRYCGEIKMPRLYQATGTILNLKINDANGVTRGLFLPPDSNATFTGNRLEWDNSPDETGSKLWERKDDPASLGPIGGLQLRIEELKKERDAALTELANTTQALQEQAKRHEADLEALRNDLKIDPSQVDIVGENRAMKVEIVRVKGDLEVYKRDLEAARHVADGLRDIIDGQKGEVEHARRQRTTWENDRNELNGLRSSQKLAEVEVANLRTELDQNKKDLLEAQTKIEEMTKIDATKTAQLEDAKTKLQQETASHNELRARHIAVLPENEVLRSEAEKQKRKAEFSVQAHEFVRQAHESLRSEHENTAERYAAMRAEHEKTRDELRQLRNENEVVKAKHDMMEAHLKAITIEHDERKNQSLDLVQKLEELKIKLGELERDNMEKDVQLSSKHNALESMQSSLRKEFSSACQVFDTPYSDYLKSCQGHSSIGIVPSMGMTDMSMLPGAVHQGTYSNPVLQSLNPSNPVFHPSMTQIVIGRVGQVVVEN